MLMLPEKTQRRTSRFVYIGHIKKEDSVYAEDNEDNKHNENNKDNFFERDFVIRKSTIDKYVHGNYCYCFNCKKILKMKQLNFTVSKDYKRGTNLPSNQFELFTKTYEEPIYECPECGHQELSDDMYTINTKYMQYRNWYLDDNKLKISTKYIVFYYLKNNFFIETVKDRMVMNLDSGYTYKLPTVKNGKKVGIIYNTTYREYPDFFYCDEYSYKCNKASDIEKKIYEIIRNYKMQKLNIFIPFYKRMYMTDIIMFNRFPTLSKDTRRSFSEYFPEKKIGRKTLNISKIRRQIKPGDYNPISTLLKAYNIPDSKSNRKIINSDIKFIIVYKMLEMYLNNYDNIKKLMITERRNNIVNNIQSIDNYCNLIQLLKDEGISENNICNKLSKTDTYTACDLYELITQIKNRNPDFEINFKSNYVKLHDELQKYFRKTKNENVAIMYDDNSHELEGTFGELTFNFAKDTYELIDVGQDMHICVGSYGNRAVNKDSNIMIARNSNNEPIICIEIDRNYSLIRQTKLKYNHHIDETNEIEYAAITKWINNNNFYLDTYDICDKYKEENNNRIEVQKIKKQIS